MIQILKKAFTGGYPTLVLLGCLFISILVIKSKNKKINNLKETETSLNNNIKVLSYELDSLKAKNYSDSLNYDSIVKTMQVTNKALLERTLYAEKLTKDYERNGVCYKINMFGKKIRIDCDDTKDN